MSAASNAERIFLVRDPEGSDVLGLCAAPRANDAVCALYHGMGIEIV
jgi:hypothetical protein